MIIKVLFRTVERRRARWRAPCQFSKRNADQSEICSLDKNTERLTLASEDVTSLPGIGI